MPTHWCSVLKCEPIEQGKMMIVDPSGNLIELKAYRQPDRVLGPLAE
jgi:extradiol dioxygenase family protein